MDLEKSLAAILKRFEKPRGEWLKEIDLQLLNFNATATEASYLLDSLLGNVHDPEFKVDKAWDELKHALLTLQERIEDLPDEVDEIDAHKAREMKREQF